MPKAQPGPFQNEGLGGKRLKGASMVRVTALSSPFLLGFDGVERALDKAAKTATDGYPPYNIERITASAQTGEFAHHARGGGFLPGADRGDPGGEPARRSAAASGTTRRANTSTAASPPASFSAASSSPKACRSLAQNLRKACCRSMSPGRSRNGREEDQDHSARLRRAKAGYDAGKEGEMTNSNG